MPFILILLMLFTPSMVLAWDSIDTALQATFLTTLMVDRGQSLTDVHKRPELGFARVFVGSDPSQRQLNQYFLGAALVHTGISVLLPKPYRTIWQSVWIGVEAETIRRNTVVGIGIRF